MAAMVVMMCGELMPHAISSSASVLLLGEVQDHTVVSLDLTRRRTDASLRRSEAAAKGMHGDASIDEQHNITENHKVNGAEANSGERLSD
uniref:Uncharacterized protein n=2 Tax=Oryza TaxID=4527 RepID=A0A0E0EQC6_9ORYZ